MKVLRIGAVFVQMLMRDIFVFKKRMVHYAINYLLIVPFLTIVAFGYIQPGVYFGPGHGKMSIILLVGTFVSSMIHICAALLAPFLYDLESDRFIDYQILLLPPTMLVFEIMLFPALITCAILLPFFPLAYAILPSYFASMQTNWIALFGMILTIALCATSYVMLAFCVMKNTFSLRYFWLRCNWPLIILGGFWLPWRILYNFSPSLGWVALINPFTYMTDGLRSVLIGSDQFIWWPFCMIALLGFFCVFSMGACYFFKRKLDHI
jgi:hypothetical protein